MWNPDQRLRLATVIQEKWWQSHRPPPKAPDGWRLGRDLNICQQLIEREGEDPTLLADALELYQGPPATLAIFWKKDGEGRRAILSELRGKALKHDREHVSPDVSELLRSVSAPPPPDASDFEAKRRAALRKVLDMARRDARVPEA